MASAKTKASETPVCDECTYMPADFEYVTPDGVKRYCSQLHYQSVRNRMVALGYVDISGGLEPDRVTFSPIMRERAPEPATDWQALAQGYANDAESLRGQLAEETRRREWAEGEIGLRERTIAALTDELSGIRKLLKLPTAV